MKLQNKALIDFKGSPLREAPPQGTAPTGEEPIITLAAILAALVGRNPTKAPYSEDENRLRWNVARQLAQVPEYVPFEFPEALLAAVKADVRVAYGPMIAGQVLEELAGPSIELPDAQEDVIA
jgi:hypothetical protein